MFCPKCKSLMHQVDDTLVCSKEGCGGSDDREYGLFKDGYYYGRVPYLKGQQIMRQQKKKGCDVCHSETVIAIMSPGWKPRPPRFGWDRPGGEWWFVKSIDEFK